MTSPPSLVSEANAEEDQPVVFSPKYAGRASLFVHLSGPANACFGFAASVPTSSNIYHQIFTSGRDDYAQLQGRSWNPDSTENRFRKRLAQAARTARDEPDFWHEDLL
jgi:hypothetical protein